MRRSIARESKGLPKNENDYVLEILSMIDEKALRYKLSNLLTWYIDKAKSNKNKYVMLSSIAILANICIPTLNIVLTSNIKIINSILAAITALCLSINSFMCFRENWRKYRSSAEKIKQIVVDYLIQVEDLDKHKGDESYTYSSSLKASMIEKINEIVTEENTNWYERYNTETNYITNKGEIKCKIVK